HPPRDRLGPVDRAGVPADAVEQRDLPDRRGGPVAGPGVQGDLQPAGPGREPVRDGVHRDEFGVLIVEPVSLSPTLMTSLSPLAVLAPPPWGGGVGGGGGFAGTKQFA